MGSKPKAPKPTAQQLAFEREQQKALNVEVQQENRRRKSLTRGRLGAVSLLSGLPADGATGVSPDSVQTGSPSPTATGVSTGTARKFKKPVKPKGNA